MKLKDIFGFNRVKGPSAPVEQPKRYNDAVLIIRQDNENNRLPVEAGNFLALKLLACETDDLLEKDLREFLPPNIRELIDDNVEFHAEGKGIDTVLNRIPNFKIRAKNGSELPLKIRVIRSLSSLHDSPRFQVVMNDSSLIESLEAHRENYRANMRGDEIFDKQTGLVSRESIVKDFELISFYTERNHKESCYAIFKFINYDDLRLQHDDEGAFKMLSSLIKIIESTKRKNDMMGIVAPGAVILIFPETPKENIKIPIARIYDKMPQDIKSEMRICYNSIKSNISPDEQLTNCMKGLAGTF